MRVPCAFLVASLVWSANAVEAVAQPASEAPVEPGAEGAASDGAGSDGAGSDGAGSDGAEPDSVGAGVADADAAVEVGGEDDEAIDPDTDPKENPHQSYYFLGLRFRDFIAPKFILNLFVDGAATVNVFSFGPELTWRRNELEIDVALSYVDLSFDPVLFKGKDDPITKFEEVSSTLKMIEATVDFLYEVYTSKRNRFSFLFGGGVGFGFVFGNLRQNQIYPVDPNNPNTDDLGQWRRCSDVDVPDIPNPGTDSHYCDGGNDHYGEFEQPSWANGGSKPNIFPYLAFPQFSFRYKPIKQLQTRADLGFAFSNGFFFGMNAAYGF